MSNTGRTKPLFHEPKNTMVLWTLSILLGLVVHKLLHHGLSSQRSYHSLQSIANLTVSKTSESFEPSESQDDLTKAMPQGHRESVQSEPVTLSSDQVDWLNRALRTFSAFVRDNTIYGLQIPKRIVARFNHRHHTSHSVEALTWMWHHPPPGTPRPDIAVFLKGWQEQREDRGRPFLREQLEWTENFQNGVTRQHA